MAQKNFGRSSPDSAAPVSIDRHAQSSMTPQLTSGGVDDDVAPGSAGWRRRRRRHPGDQAQLGVQHRAVDITSVGKLVLRIRLHRTATEPRWVSVGPLDVDLVPVLELGAAGRTAPWTGFRVNMPYDDGRADGPRPRTASVPARDSVGGRHLHLAERSRARVIELAPHPDGQGWSSDTGAAWQASARQGPGGARSGRSVRAALTPKPRPSALGQESSARDWQQVGRFRADDDQARPRKASARVPTQIHPELEPGDAPTAPTQRRPCYPPRRAARQAPMTVSHGAIGPGPCGASAASVPIQGAAEWGLAAARASSRLTDLEPAGAASSSSRVCTVPSGELDALGSRPRSPALTE